MSDIRQSPEYTQFIKSLGWQVEKIGQGNVFIKKFPIIGSLLKIQRIEPPIPFAEIENLAQKYRAFRIILEPSFSPSSPSQPDLPAGRHGPQPTTHPHNYHLLKSPFIPTKTLILDINRPEKEIFNSFSKNKRRDIRIAERNKLIVKEGQLEDFIQLKKHYLLKKHILPILVGRDIKLLCQAFGPEKSKILIVIARNEVTKQSHPIAGTILLFHSQTAYYWQAAATDRGKKLLAPTILLWEAIKLAKKKGCTKFDFEGVYDERFPKNKSWQGFTHFKQGFGGKEIEFPLPLSSFRFPLNIL